MSLIDIINIFEIGMILYLGCGVAYAFYFYLKGMHKLDTTTSSGTLGFRLIIFPSVLALWPILALAINKEGRPIADLGDNKIISRQSLLLMGFLVIALIVLAIALLSRTNTIDLISPHQLLGI